MNPIASLFASIARALTPGNVGHPASLTPTMAIRSKMLTYIAAWEGGGLAGDFDGQILSWGPLQWNLGQGTLYPLLVEVANLSEHAAAVLGPELLASLKDPDSFTAFVRAKILTGPPYASGGRRPGDAWVLRFQELYRVKGVDAIFQKYAEPYFRMATRLAIALNLNTERGFMLCFDTAVQNGTIHGFDWTFYVNSLDEGDNEEWERLKKVAKAMAAGSNPPYQADVLSRKLTIAVRTGTVHGRDYDIQRDFGVSYDRTWY